MTPKSPSLPRIAHVLAYRGLSPNRRKFRQAAFQGFDRLAAYPVSRFTFCGSRDPIDLDAVLANLTMQEREQRLSPIVDSIRLGPKCRWKLPDGNFGGLGDHARTHAVSY
jgi:hypothetical protein